MNDIPEIDNSQSISAIMESAFGYWKKTLGIQVLFSVIYFGLFMVFAMGLFQYFGLMDDMEKFRNMDLGDLKAITKLSEELAQKKEMQYFALCIVIVKALLFPLNVGFYKIYQKIDQGLGYNVSDLFAGFQGGYFFKFFGYALFWGMIYTFTNNIPMVLPLIWILVTLLITPIIYFKNTNIIEGLKLNFSVLKSHFLTFFVCVIVAGLFSYAGILLFGIGYLLTFPFWNAMIYAMYKALVEHKTIEVIQ